MDRETEKRLKRISASVRKDVIRMIVNAHSGHLASSLSIVDFLVYLYWVVMDISPEDPNKRERDRLVLSKGHGCPGLYAILAHRGFFGREELWNYRRLGSFLQGHPDCRRTPGIDAPSGSLGLGLGIANGMAMAMRMDGLERSRVFCVVGDGELQEGAIWESAMTTPHHGLNNVVLIVDDNGSQMEGKVEDIKNIHPLGEKFAAFGWRVIKTQGHDFPNLEAAFEEAGQNRNKPCVIIARTVLGKGVSFLEERRSSASIDLSRDQLESALRQVELEVRRLEEPLG